MVFRLASVADKSPMTTRMHDADSDIVRRFLATSLPILIWCCGHNSDAEVVNGRFAKVLAAQDDTPLSDSG